MGRSRLLGVVALVLAMFLLTACAAAESEVADSPESTASTATTELEPEPESPNPTAEVIWFWSNSDTEAPVFRFVSTISNPGSQPLVGVETEWVAYDADNSIVGSFKGQRPVIPAGESIPYTGGAGGANLTGVPARVEVSITAVGRFVDEVPSFFTVSDVSVTADATNEYTVTAKATSGDSEVVSANIAASVVLRNEAGEIVGCDFWLSEGLPERLPANSTFNIEVSYILTTGTATTADVVVVQDS